MQHVQWRAPARPATAARLKPLARSRCVRGPCPSESTVRAMEPQPPRMTADEKRLARSMHFEQGKSRTQIARTLKRALSSISRLLAQKRAPKPIGRPRLLTEGKIDRIVALLEKMVNDASGNHEVTMDMLMRRGRIKVGRKVVARALHARGYRFRDLRQKPILTPEDIVDRYKWAKKYARMPRAWWLGAVHVHLDNHVFKVATTPKGRRLLAKRRVRGVYRQVGKALTPAHVKPSAKLHLSVGAKGILKAGGVGGGQVLVWHTVHGAWSGRQAAELYTDVVKPALRARYPRTKQFCILEDNDPTGNQSKKGIEAKRLAKLEVFRIPKRSPDLNVLDYAIWSEVERRMRAQEKTWRADKHETREAFERRLDRTARGLSKAYIDNSIMDLHRRCKRLRDAEGGLFEEGGRRKRAL